MEKKMKEPFWIVVTGVCLFAALMHASTIIGFVRKTIRLILPIIVGGILALFMNVPMAGIEKRLRRLFEGRKKSPSEKGYRTLSFLLTFVGIAFVLGLVFTLLIPELVKSTQSLISMVDRRIPEWIVYLDSHNINAQWLEDLLEGVDVKETIQNVTSQVDLVLEGVMDTLSSTVSVLSTAMFGLIIAIYMVLDKERLERHSKYILFAYVKPKWAERIARFCRMFASSFASFLSGQCGEALILGSLMCFAFAVFRLPYALLVGVLTAVCAIIPYVGAFISCAISIFLAMIFDPSLVIRCAAVYLIVQFIENQFIYPRVVGGSVGLPPLYTLIAALVGGKLFGVLGILFFIPLAAVVSDLLKESTKKRRFSA